jgi:hypothetical protein
MDGAMIVLRWVVGIGCALGLAALALILTVGKGFDGFRSGAGSEDLLRDALTIGLPLLLAAMLATVFGAGGRPLLHLTAAGVLAALAGVLWAVVRTNPGEGSLYAAFLILWLIFYALRLR